MLVSVQDLLRALAERKLTLAVAEGDTGGLLLQQLTAMPGSSAVVLGGVVAYADSLKCELLQVPRDLLQQHGAVSAEAARAMAAGVRQLAGADIGLATTGIAGPGGATVSEPLTVPFFPELNAPDALTGPLTVSLFVAFGWLPPPLMQSATAVMVTWTWASSPRPASLPLTVSVSPLSVTEKALLMKCGLPAATGAALGTPFSSSAIGAALVSDADYSAACNS